VCGPYTFGNTATFLAGSGADGSASATVNIDVPCEIGCTLTPGYWKTHSSYGPAPYDDTWAMIPGGADAIFFLSGKTYHQVLWTPPQGNVYYILAHAYIAAQLNRLNGASFQAAATAFNQATSILQSATPASLAGVKGMNKNVIVGLAATLDGYNNGLIGPGHCSE